MTLRDHLAVAAYLARAVVREFRRGGLRKLPQNLAESSSGEMLDLQARIIGAPLVEFDTKSGKVKARA